MAKNDCLYLPESTRGSYETINAAVMYKLGLEPQDNSFPLKLPFTTQINTNSNMGSRVATFTKGPAYMENIQATYIPVNALPEYRMLGACTTADGVHTITTAAVTVAKPSLTMFRQGQATTEKWKVAGAVSNSLQAAGTGSTVVSKLLMAANTAYYKQYSLTMYIVNMSDNFRLDDGTDRCVVTMIGSDPTITCKDGVSHTFYGEEA
jgi:hypothetical protein